MRFASLILVSALLGAAVEPCRAQSSVTISGLIDSAVTFVSNSGGGHSLNTVDGVVVPDLLIFSGSEDLGGGDKAIFKLTNQFLLNSGSFVPGQGLFKTAYVGLDSRKFGQLTLGAQYDFIFDSLVVSFDDAAYYAGLFALPNGPFNKLALPNNPTGAFDWNRGAGVALPNAVKYVSPVFSGFSAGAMYSFGNVAGSIGASNGSSFALNYSNGGFSANAAYTLAKSATAAGQASVRNWGVGTRYNLGPVTTSAVFEAVHNSANRGGIWQGLVGAQWRITNFWSLNGTYAYMKGNAVLDNNHAHQFSAMAQYYLSKRTSLYAQAVYQRTNQGAQAQINAVFVPSSGASQFLGAVGITTFF